MKKYNMILSYSSSERVGEGESDFWQYTSQRGSVRQKRYTKVISTIITSHYHCLYVCSLMHSRKQAREKEDINVTNNN